MDTQNYEMEKDIQAKFTYGFTKLFKILLIEQRQNKTDCKASGKE